MKAGSIDEDEGPQTDAKPPFPGDVRGLDTGQSDSASQQPETSTLNVTGLNGQIRLTELLKVIAHKRIAKGALTTAHHQQEAIAGPSVPTLCSSLRPLRKAKYSWQVKNNMEQRGQTSANPAEDAGLLVELNDKGSYATDVSVPNEPPPKKVKVITDDDSGETYTIQRTSVDNHFNHSAAAPKGDDNSLQSEAKTLDISASQSRKVPETHMETNKSQQPDLVKALTVPSTPSHAGQQTGVFARWQGRHVAQSIVDNAINATLEVLGFSFDSDMRNPSQTISAAQRRHLEADAVSVVIQARGLQGTESVTAVDGNRIRNNLLQNNLEQHIHSQAEAADSSRTCIPQAIRASLLHPQATRSSLLEAEATRSSLLDAKATRTSLLNAEATKSSLLDAEATRSSLLGAGTTGSSLPNAEASRSSLSDAELTRSSLLDPQGRSSSLMEPILNHLRHRPGSVVAVNDSAVSPFSISNQPILAGRTQRERVSGKQCDDYEDLDTLFPPALQTDVLNKAVSAAISQKGLAMDGAL